MIINDPNAVTIDRTAFEFNGRMCYGVRKRGTRELLGHVARSMQDSAWSYLLVTEKEWVTAGPARADAVDHLQSAYAPMAPWLSTEK
jgi:hypothetical protein